MQTFADNWQTQLGAAGVNASATSIPVTTLTGAPAAGAGSVWYGLLENEILRVTDQDPTGLTLTVSPRTSGVAHNGNLPIYHIFSAAALAEVQSGALIDSSFTDQATNCGGSYGGVEGSSWNTVGGLSCNIPPGVAFSLEWSGDLGLYANAAVAGTFLNLNMQFVNSAGAVVPGVGYNGVQKRFRSKVQAPNDIFIVPASHYIELGPLAAQDVFSLQCQATASGTGTQSAGVVGVTGYQSMRARVL